jgi:tRNA threonylcarbamoyladenosine biosynthesis protein TsaB
VRVLAIETSTPIASVAVVDAGGVLASRTLRAPMRHLEWVAAAIDGMLHDLGAGAASVEGVAVGRGPGGFTGLRIGIATAAAWARARGVPIASVGTLEILACSAAAAGLVLPLLDAHRGEVAAALYRFDQGRATPAGRKGRKGRGGGVPPDPQCLVPPVVAAPAAVVAEMRAVLEAEDAASCGLLLAGDGLVRHAGAFETALAGLGVTPFSERADAYPRAEVAGVLARSRLVRGARDDPSAVLPIYGRRLAVRPWQETQMPAGSEA